MKICGGEDQTFLYEVPEAININFLTWPCPIYLTPAERLQCIAVERETMTDWDITISCHQTCWFKICGVISFLIIKQEVLEASLIFWHLWLAVTEELYMTEPEGCTEYRITEYSSWVHTPQGMYFLCLWMLLLPSTHLS